MSKITSLEEKSREVKQFFSQLEEIAREGARHMIQLALEDEVNQYIELFTHLQDESNRRLVVRNGYKPAREILTGLGPLKIRQPRVDDKRPDETFSSSILPAYMRRFPSMDNLIPLLYLKGISTGEMQSSLQAILGPGAKNVSAKTVERLKNQWSSEYQIWSTSDLSNKNYVYLFADGIYFNVRLEKAAGNKKQCILILLGVLADGRKELVGVLDGYRESTLNWKELLQNLCDRGLRNAPKLAIGDGAMGFWAALEEVFPETRHQRCWVHVTGNVLNKMPKCIHSKAKSEIHDIYLADTRENALKAYEHFLNTYKPAYPGACKCLEKNFDALFAFYDFPADHWQHIRTTNPIESTFATVRLRTGKTRGCGNREATLTMVWKLCLETSSKWRKIRGFAKIANVISGIKFTNGFTESEWKERLAA